MPVAGSASLFPLYPLGALSGAGRLASLAPSGPSCFFRPISWLRQSTRDALNRGGGGCSTCVRSLACHKDLLVACFTASASCDNRFAAVGRWMSSLLLKQLLVLLVVSSQCAWSKHNKLQNNGCAEVGFLLTHLLPEDRSAVSGHLSRCRSRVCSSHRIGREAMEPFTRAYA